MTFEIRPDSRSVLADATLPELPSPYHGKVRDNYDLPNGRRIIIATDRISAFDWSSRYALALFAHARRTRSSSSRSWMGARQVMPEHT